MKLKFTVLFVAIVFVLMACGSDNYESTDVAPQSTTVASPRPTGGVVAESVVVEDSLFEFDEEFDFDDVSMASSEEMANLFEDVLVLLPEDSGRLLSYMVEFSLETEYFMEGIGALWDEISRLNGYVEHERISGRNLRHPSEERFAHFNIRIPNRSLSTLISFIAAEFNLVHYRRDMIDFTFLYEGNEGLVDDLRDIENQLLEELDDEENRNTRRTANELRDIRAHIRRLEQENRQIERDVNYSIISISLHEVIFVEPLPVPPPPTFWESLTNATSISLSFLGSTLQFLFIAVLTLLPWAIIIAIFAVPCVILARKLKQRGIVKQQQYFDEMARLARIKEEKMNKGFLEELESPSDQS